MCFIQYNDINCKKDTKCIRCEIVITNIISYYFNLFVKRVRGFSNGGSVDTHSKLLPLLPRKD